MTRITARRLAIGATLAAVVILTGCATATGPQFAGLEPVPQAQAHVYLYRNGAIYASAAAFDVAHNGKPAGKLFNASYLLLPVAPGEHSFTVDERGLTSPKSFNDAAEAGRRYFFEYDASKGLLLGLGLLSGSRGKSEAEALGDLKELRRAQ